MINHNYVDYRRINRVKLDLYQNFNVTKDGYLKHGITAFDIKQTVYNVPIFHLFFSISMEKRKMTSTKVYIA